MREKFKVYNTQRIIFWKNFPEETFAERGKNRETTKVYSFKVLHTLLKGSYNELNWSTNTFLKINRENIVRQQKVIKITTCISFCFSIRSRNKLQSRKELPY